MGAGVEAENATASAGDQKTIAGRHSSFY